MILGNNVLAHVPDQNRFVAGIATILPRGSGRDRGPIRGDMVDHCEFDTIYHEHHCIFSVTALCRPVQQARARPDPGARFDPRRVAPSDLLGEGHNPNGRWRSTSRRSGGSGSQGPRTTPPSPTGWSR